MTTINKIKLWLFNTMLLGIVFIYVFVACSSPSSRRSKERARQLTEQLNNVPITQTIENIVGESDEYTLELIHEGKAHSKGDFDIYRLEVDYMSGTVASQAGIGKKNFIIVDNGQFGITMSNY